MKRCSRIAATILVLLSLASQGAFAKDKKQDPEQTGNRDVGKGVNFYSIEKEIALGKQMATQVERHAIIIDDPVVAEYVNRVGQNLVRNSDAKVPFTIKVLDVDEVNAFALPGGFFFVNSGMILNADSEAELAGVMAHEIAHVAARHGTRQASRAGIVNYASIPLIFRGGWAGYGIWRGANVAIPLTFLNFSRAFEREADYLGLQYLYKAGYDPTSFVDFFEKIQSMETKQPGLLSKAFSTHPMTDERIKLAQQEIQTILVAKPQYIVNTSEFNEVKNRLTSLHDRRKVDPEQHSNRPQLRRMPGAERGPADENSGDEKQKPDQDERPTEKRRAND